ncbi:MAG: DUF5103 domain-containing protein [Bacteroidales bacterium]|nr:DUF5103 domain-containing protein [Candidatus Physcousia equi]
MKNQLLSILFLLTIAISLSAQRNTILDTDHLRSLQTIAMDDPLLPCVMDRQAWRVEIGFDEMSHEPHRYRYHIDHCEADWTPSEDLFESNYLAGLNDQLIEDYEKSFNTTQIYTHYALRLPNEQTNLLLSGNYRVTIYDEDDDEHAPLATAEFCLVDPVMHVALQVDGNTDIDFQRHHQQVAVDINYGVLRVTDPARELKTFVVQNRRQERTVAVQPNIRKAGGAEFTHQRSLIFPAGNECHKFELLDVHRVNLNVDNMRWFEPYFHATLYETRPQRSYVFEHDANGAYVMRNADNEDNETTCEYVYVHFRLKSEPLPGGPVYVQGLWCNNWPCEDYRMEYDEEEEEYRVAVLLKQGYYDYRFVQLEGEEVTQGRTDGDFFQTNNEYQVLVYYKEPGGRYDRLVGYARTKE